MPQKTRFTVIGSSADASRLNPRRAGFPGAGPALAAEVAITVPAATISAAAATRMILFERMIEESPR
jgi:hypothetical protein